MESSRFSSSFILGLFVFLGLAVLGYLLGESAIRYKEYERTVRVKGLSEKEYPANIVMWPIRFIEAENDLAAVYTSLEEKAGKIRKFLKTAGLDDSEITVAAPKVTDKVAQSYGGQQKIKFRYSAEQAITVYSKKVEKVRGLINRLAELGKEGIVFTGRGYPNTEYIFTELNQVKPEMIEEATRKAREVAEKFSKDSKSSLGKIKRATQGQFSISPRDRHNPHIKKVRVVSTVEYYLSD